MAAFFNVRRKVMLFILFLLIVFAFASASSNYWLQWIFLAASWAFFILIDMLFLTEDTFIYDPSYKTWSVRAGYEEK